MIVLAATCLALVALLAYRERGSARERAADQRYREAMARELIEQRQAAAAERRELYQRIQAPEIAVAEAHRESRGPYVPRKPIGADDDAAFNGRGSTAEAE